MRIAHFGTFDVANYGDLLFPLIVERQLSSVADEFVHVSPLGGQPYADVPASLSFQEAKQQNYDAVIVGGGNILHARTTSLPDYYRVRHRAYPGLWGDAASLAARQKIPLVVNAPGASADFSRAGRTLLSAMLARADYVAVRDTYSADRVQAASSRRARVVPDTALSLATVLPTPTLDLRTIQGVRAIRATHAELRPGQYIAVHINDRYGTDGAGILARSLDELSAVTGLEICLLGIGKCHGDDQFIAAVSAKMMSSPFTLADPTRVQEVSTLIARSAFYVGSSLHGFITATSYRVPGYLVASHEAQSKFMGLLEHLRDTARMVSDWDAVPSTIGAAYRAGALNTPPGIDDVEAQLQSHWETIKQLLKTGRTPGDGAPSALATRSLLLLNTMHNLAGEKQRHVRGRLRRRSGAN